MWKVYHIPSGRIVKAGFDSEDEAKDWLDRRELADEEHDVDEMDEEEEEEYLEAEAEVELDDEDEIEDEYEEEDDSYDQDDELLGSGMSYVDEEEDD